MFKNRITQHGRYVGIITVLLVYLIPWVWMRGIYKRLFEFFRHAETKGEELTVCYAQIKSGAVRFTEHRIINVCCSYRGCGSGLQ